MKDPQLEQDLISIIEMAVDLTPEVVQKMLATSTSASNFGCELPGFAGPCGKQPAFYYPVGAQTKRMPDNFSPVGAFLCPIHAYSLGFTPVGCF